jgi:hypothetical protein
VVSGLHFWIGGVYVGNFPNPLVILKTNKTSACFSATNPKIPGMFVQVIVTIRKSEVFYKKQR